MFTRRANTGGVLIGVEAAAVERALLLWQEQLLGPTQDKLVIVDGKTLRHATVRALVP